MRAALDVGERQLLRAGVRVLLAPKAFDLLVALVRRAGRLRTKAELLEQVWPEAFVEEGILAVHVSALRKALGDHNRPPRFIETVPGSGHRFVAAVTRAVVAEGGAAPARPARPAEVYELVGRGRLHLLSAKLGDLPQAEAAFGAAIALDPTYAEAHAGLALTCCAQAELHAVPAPEAYGQAARSALRALAMDSRCADAHVAQGSVLFLSEWDWAGAERSFTRALEINPDYTEAYLLYGRLLEALGEVDRGLEMKLRALERDPHSPLVHLQIAMAHWHRRRYDETIAWATRALDIDERHLLAREFLAGAYWAMGDFDRHMEENLRHAAHYGVDGQRARPVAAGLCRRWAPGRRAAHAAWAAGRAAPARSPVGGAPRRSRRSRCCVPAPRSGHRRARPLPGSPRRGPAVGQPARRPAVRREPPASGSRAAGRSRLTGPPGPCRGSGTNRIPRLGARPKRHEGPGGSLHPARGVDGEGDAELKFRATFDDVRATADDV
jgi:DNA-binding winged helix-turn-helix (wHTH) protein